MQIRAPKTAFLASLALAPILSAQGQEGKVDFVKQVYPILKKACFECHGAEEQEADLRLDKKSGLFVADKEDWVVLPGNSKESELYARITLPHDDDEIMPPEGDPLTKKEIEIIRKWIDEGADWPDTADAVIQKAVAAATPKIETFALPELSTAQQTAEKKAIAAVKKAGGLAMRVAANTTASEVNLSLLGKKVQNEHVALTSGLSGTLVRLNLARTAIDDAALATVAGHEHLRWLNLSNTKVTDAGLAKLAGLDHLRYLNLWGTAVTDAGLQHLHGLKGLRKVFLWQTKATKKGAAALQQALPGVKVDMGEYAAVLKSVKPAKPAKKPGKKAVAAINKTCPVANKPVKAGKTVTHQGQVIGLCCDNCVKKFRKNPAKFLGKVAEFKAAGKTAANAKCPVSGRAVVAEAQSSYQGKTIGFCCKNCKAKFDKDPKKFHAKLAGIFEK